MAKYRKRPIVIEAEQFVHPADNVDGVIPGFVSGCLSTNENGVGCPDSPHIHTLEGPLHVSMLDWIIRGIAGEVYPCKPDIFERAYEAVVDA